MEFGNNVGRNARRKLWPDVKMLVNNEAPTLIDGGSNIGECIKIFLDQYTNPTIYAIEANPELAQKLGDRFRDNPAITVIAKAIGSIKGELPFHIANNLNSSSFFARGVFNEKYHGTLTDFSKTITVPVTRLDAEVSPNISIDVLKLDLEGYELKALKGATGILDDVKVIVTEIEFVDEYKDAPRFSEVELFLREHKFLLFNFYDLYTNPDGQLTTGDAIFINNRYFPAET